jgi:anti-sigma regulatory factor (Ser/Thr protein kinase)
LNSAGRGDLAWTIEVEAAAARLADVRRFVEEVTSQLAVDGERVFDLKVAVCEAFSNAVEHSCGVQEILEVSATVRARRLTFVVTDTGIFRPPLAARDKYSGRGLGLPLMVTLMDEVSFCRAAHGGTSVSLSVQLDRT